MASTFRAPDELQRSEARFRTIFEQSPVSTQIFAPDGTTIAVNRAWEELWGVTLDQIAGYNILQDEQLVRRGVMPYIVRAFAGEPGAIPAIRYAPDETIPGTGAVPYRWVAASIYPVRDEEGTICEVVLMHEDITERKKAEEALRQSEDWFRTVFEGAPVGISVMDGEGRYLAVNPVRQQMLGYGEDELIGRFYQELTHPDDVAYDEQVNAEARDLERNHFQLEKRFVRKDGAVVWSRMTISTVRDERGEPIFSISVAEDITQRKEAEQALARAYEMERLARWGVERLAAERAAILGQIADGIIIADPDGRITFVNEVAARIHGVAELGVPVEGYSDRYHLLTMDRRPYPPEDLPLARAVSHGETVVDAEWRIRRPDGTEVVAQGSATPLVADDGTRLGAALVVRDVTAQHDLERQKDDFLSAVAHDLRTPLTGIKGRVQLLRLRAARGTLDQDNLLADLERIEGSAGKMVGLIKELLDVANIQIGRPLSLNRGPTDLVSLVRAQVAEHQQADDRHRMIVEAGVPELVGQWDASRLERVLGNLLSNAMKYSSEGEDITVALDREGEEWAVLSVTDRGVGIPAEDLPHIFSRFHRGENVVGKIAGTGIGLAAVRDTVEQHGGTVSVTSREGAGSTFTVRLPLASS